MAKVSIVIPVYNVEKYLSQCLDSIINQSLNDIEIICVDDGSKDASGKILDDYAEKDSRIVVIHKENEGVAIARNLGVEKAKGQYLMFVDSDDVLIPTACESAYDIIVQDNSDIVIYGHSFLDNDNNVRTPSKFLQDKHIQYDRFAQIPKDLMVYIWDKIYDLEFIKNNDIKFLTGCKTAEDIAFCWSCYLNNAKISVITAPLYNYRLNDEGATGANFHGIASDFHTFKEFEKLDLYKIQPDDIKYRIIDRFALGYEFYYEKNCKNKVAKNFIDSDMKEFCEYLKANYSPVKIGELSAYKKFKNRYYKRIKDGLFSIKNEFTLRYKVITILGYKIRILRK